MKLIVRVDWSLWKNPTKAVKPEDQKTVGPRIYTMRGHSYYINLQGEFKEGFAFRERFKSRRECLMHIKRLFPKARKLIEGEMCYERYCDTFEIDYVE